MSNKITSLIPSEGALAVLNADHRILFSTAGFHGEELQSFKKTSESSTQTIYSDNSEYIYTFGALPSYHWLLAYEHSNSTMLSLLFHVKTVSFLIVIISLILAAVSYTHLDVYKRQCTHIECRYTLSHLQDNPPCLRMLLPRHSHPGVPA